MKNTFKFLIIAAAVMTFTTNSFAQGASATSDASATIVTPIAITNTVPLNFGNVAVATTPGGTVVLATDGSRTTTGGVTLPTIDGSPTAASFTVTGTVDYTYTVTLPIVASTILNGANNMTINAFTSNPAATPGAGTLTLGTQTLLIGATLNVGAAQAAGLYTADDIFTITVDYN